MQLSDEARPLVADAAFQNEEVKDASGFDWGTERDRADIAASLKGAIDWELTQANLAGTGYVLRTDIVRYEPGNAFKRWLMPGFEATRLNVVGKVCSPGRASWSSPCPWSATSASAAASRSAPGKTSSRTWPRRSSGC